MRSACAISLGVCLTLACHGRTKHPVTGPVEVSGTCGAEVGSQRSETDADYGFGLADDVDRVAVELSIEDGHLAKARFETNDFITGQIEGGGVIVWSGEATPRTQLAVGQWIDVDVPIRRVDAPDVVRTTRVRLRVVGEEMEFMAGGKPVRGPCQWGHAEE